MVSLERRVSLGSYTFVVALVNFYLSPVLYMSTRD